MNEQGFIIFVRKKFNTKGNVMSKDAKDERKVSVRVPVFHKPMHLSSTVTSVKNTCDHIELLVECIESFNDKNPTKAIAVHAAWLPENLNKIRNDGIKSAATTILATIKPVAKKLKCVS